MTARLLWLLAGLGVAAGPLLAAVADDLLSVEGRSTVKLTTIGRKSGKPRTVTVWFVHDAGRVYVQAGKAGHTQWYRNLRKNPEVTLDFGGLVLRGRARPIEDPPEVERVHALFRKKYWLARAASWFGARFGRGTAVLIDSLEASG